LSENHLEQMQFYRYSELNFKHKSEGKKWNGARKKEKEGEVNGERKRKPVSCIFLSQCWHVCI